MRTKQHSAFTLIEVLIVVVIMAILAATIIPEFASTTDDAKESAVNYNLRSMQGAIEFFKLHHMGSSPSVLVFGTDQWLPELTLESDATCAYNQTGVSDKISFPYGPYFDEVPKNPYNNKSSVTAGDGSTEDLAFGWQYDAATGKIYSSVIP